MTTEELKAILKKEGNYKAFEYKGYKCRIIRMGEGMPFEYRLFHLCWYVLLTKEDKRYGKDWSEIPYVVHGGITYSSSKLHLQPEENWRWIGFDCGHAGDLSGTYQLDKEYIFWTHSTYKTIEFVEQELKDLVEQILADRQEDTIHTTKVNKSNWEVKKLKKDLNISSK